MTHKKSIRYDGNYMDPLEHLNSFGKCNNIFRIASMLGIVTQNTDPVDHDVVNIGHQITLITDKSIENNISRYSHLYKDGVKISNTYFRLGGFDTGFNNKLYASLIHYPNYPIDKECWGNHCIIDSNGKIVLEAEKFDSSLYYLDGVIAKKRDIYINLLTGEPIVKSYSTSLKSKEFIFVECNDYEDKFKKGIYKINKNTGEFEIFE